MDWNNTSIGKQSTVAAHTHTQIHTYIYKDLYYKGPNVNTTENPSMTYIFIHQEINVKSVHGTSPYWCHLSSKVRSSLIPFLK